MCANRISIMSQRTYNKISNENGIVTCRRCNKEIKIEDDYVWKESGHNAKSKRYHLRCAKEVNII